MRVIEAWAAQTNSGDDNVTIHYRIGNDPDDGFKKNGDLSLVMDDNETKAQFKARVETGIKTKEGIA